ncbi:unannotated protein [freshwater metagenome]|uniref:Unannotated protein n=1 Tax=freshwater metagenome TaxID=449393 RepID=A0A6J7JNB7_9ZZZZ
MREQCPTPVRVELGKDVVEQQNRRSTRAVGDHLMRRQSQGERQGPLLTLRCVGAGRHPVDGQLQFVAMGADQRGSPTQFIAADSPEGRSQPRFAPGCVVDSIDVGTLTSNMVVGRPQNRGKFLDKGGAGVCECLTHIDQLRVPDHECRFNFSAETAP